MDSAFSAESDAAALHSGLNSAFSEVVSEARYVIGIDLGTTHCALAVAAIERPNLRLIEIPQLVAPGEVDARRLLPSFLYLPASGELAPSDSRLPWTFTESSEEKSDESGKPNKLDDVDVEDALKTSVVGEVARRLGSKAAHRLVASAKSWVCHGGVNRRAPILPWGAPEDEPHVSPFAAQVAYLQHLRAAWEHAHPEAPMCEQDVVVTVPASFDEAARELTFDAARKAGLGEVRLLEEPQAAFYDYLGVRDEAIGEDNGASSDKAETSSSKLVLVVDVGGGTTDLTLLRVELEERRGDAWKPDGAFPEELIPQGSKIERIAVGGHLMLGGDNMDAALAMFALEKAGRPRPDDAAIWSALVMSARQAKERLLGVEEEEQAPDQVVLSLQSRGSRLFGKVQSLPITREEAQKVLVEGFMPMTGIQESAGREGRAGLTTLGLPYTRDTAIPRHIAAFLRRHAAAVEQSGLPLHQGLPRPDMVLLNGGVFKAPALVARLQAVLDSWFAQSPGGTPRMLDPTSLDTAVASGAARSALARRGLGALIAGGAARAYYIVIDEPAKDSAKDSAKDWAKDLAQRHSKRLLCIAPHGMEEGNNIDLSQRVFQALLERPVSFQLLAYNGDRGDAPGDLIDDPRQQQSSLAANSASKDTVSEGSVDQDVWEELPTLETVLRSKKNRSLSAGSSTVEGVAIQDQVAVTLRVQLSDTGALELYLVTVALPPERWRLGFALYPTATSVSENKASASQASEVGTEDSNTSSSSNQEDKQEPQAGAKAKNTGQLRTDPPESPDPPDPQVKQAESMIQRAFDAPAAKPEAAKGIRQNLEKLLGPRGQWSAATCRALWKLCMASEAARKTSETHELAWLRLCGYCLRPGFGFLGDADRIDQLWTLLRPDQGDQGLQHPSKANWSQWWILWRFVVAGLDASRQQSLFENLEPWLWPEVRAQRWPGQKLPPHFNNHAHGPIEMMQLLAVFEELEPSTKERIGELLWTRIKKLRSYWSLGRVGTRVPFQGKSKNVVSKSTAETWLQRLLELDWSSSQAEGSTFAAVSLARLSGESQRDVEVKLREQVLERLVQARAPANWIEMLSRAPAAGEGEGDSKSVFGESLPSGLRLG